MEKNNEAERVQQIAEKLSKGFNIALVSEAGTPNISDPGAHLISKIREKGFEIIPISGPSAVTTILSVSGMLANQFIFMGFFPKKESEAKKDIERIQYLNIPICYFESGQRILKTLQTLQKILPKKECMTELFIAKELTKIHETFFYGTLADVLPKITSLAAPNLKGEWCFILKLESKKTLSLKPIDQLKKLQLKNNQILKIATEILGLPKNEVYRYLIRNRSTCDVRGSTGGKS